MSRPESNFINVQCQAHFPQNHTHNCTNLLALGPRQDDCSTAGVFDPILATLEVYPLPAEALEGVQTRTGRPQEGRPETTPPDTEERLTWVQAPGQTCFITHWWTHDKQLQGRQRDNSFTTLVFRNVTCHDSFLKQHCVTFWATAPPAASGALTV